MIRPATQEDAGRLVEMGYAFFIEAGHESDATPFDPESFVRTLALLASHGLLLVVEKDGAVIGMAAADVAPAFWNHKILLGREAFWYVEPAHRKGIGRELLKALEALVTSLGATLFDVVAEDGKRSEALARLYRAGEYNPAERTFRKRLDARL